MLRPDKLSTPHPPGRSTRLQFTLWLDVGSAWHAQVEWSEWGATVRRDFDSPLELARFMARLPLQPPLVGGLR